MSASSIPTIVPDADVPMPVQPLGVEGDKYVFRLADGSTTGLTFLALSQGENLLALCGGNGAWLRRYFPSFRRLHGTRAVICGIECLVAANFLADLCVDAEKARILAAPRGPARRPWWQRLRDWLLSLPAGWPVL
jgi:hypothetical protein